MAAASPTPTPPVRYNALSTPELDGTAEPPRWNMGQHPDDGTRPIELPVLPDGSQQQSMSGGTKANSPDVPIGKLEIQMHEDALRPIVTPSKYRPDFKFNMELALRTAVGVVIASMALTKSSDSTTTRSQWVFFPEWNIGSTIRELFQQLTGVGLALLFNLLLFSHFEPQVFDTAAELEAAKADGTLIRISNSFSGSPYYVHERDFYTILPFTMGLTLVALVLPMETNTKKYLLGNNLYFALTLVSPNDLTNPALLKAPGDDLYRTSNLLRNLMVYLVLGVAGACIAQVVLWVPYPIFAIRQLQTHTMQCADMVEEVLNLLVDTYCFKNKDVDHMNFVKLKLQRKFDVAEAKLADMTTLLSDVWWEQLVGLHVPLQFCKPATKPFVELFGHQLQNLRALNQAILWERYDALHDDFMKALQKQVYLVQLHATKVLDEIADDVHRHVDEMALRERAKLEQHVEQLLALHHATQNNLFHKHSPMPAQVEAMVPLNLFLFTLQAYCTTLVEFEATYNSKTRQTRRRIVKFVEKSAKSYLDAANYTREKLQMAAKVWFAILAACFFSVYTFGYSSTTAGAVAYVMGNHIGGSFTVTANRVGGVIAGSIIPSICLFYICSTACGSNAVVLGATNLLLFIWVTASMYIKWKGGFESYGGLISAFTVTQVLLKGCDGCDTGAVAPISSYSNLAQMSLGIVLFIVVEMVVCPQSALALLRANIQNQMKQYQHCFSVLVDRMLAHDGRDDNRSSTDNDDIEDVVKEQLPALLVEQAALLKEAAFEPLLWKPPFSTQKYEAVLDCCQRLLNNTLVLFKLTEWYKSRTSGLGARAKEAMGGLHRLPVGENKAEAWGFSTAEASRAIHDAFSTIHDLFGSEFAYADGDQTALFMQMKEAFRMADTDCSGEIDADEVQAMLESMFAQSGAVKVDAIDTYVAEFMRLVDTDKSGRVSLEEFVSALEHGLQVQVQVFQHRSAARAMPQRQPRMGNSEDKVLVSIAEDNVAPSPPWSVDMATATAILESPQRKVSAGSGASADNNRVLITRAHDLLLNVDSFGLVEIVQKMRTQYATWLLEGHRYNRMTMEELLTLNCLVMGVTGLARNLALLEEMSVLQ
ncbi:hypothetical protein, variant [Aphanomyces invadans]|uniref:EF-hand domain-containing protein n=1 Tax=Aphanomyces invadans TaxID=157072 RepID=A0A024TKX5_9STRA|nr:hypothetical protein, variant [Aphanomyces invadans]ETV94795.1 hypothetical protein, variant [Aphanomyces invadans]|eukprot:XP_008876386.1 hypothetical protein, variant [Aphanomyces invadans]